GALIALVDVDRASPWIAAIIVGRELLILGLRGVVAADGTVFPPSIWGKLKTNVQFIAIFLAIVRWGGELGPLRLDEWAMVAAAVPGDVLDLEALTTAMQGCDLVYHAAGANAFCVRDPSPMFEVNVRGSENLVRAAARAEVKRVVYTSSAATLGERKGAVGSE